MYIHVVLFKWKPNVAEADVAMALLAVEQLQNKIPGVVEIMTGENESKYSEGYTHVVLVRAESKKAIMTYREHPDHVVIAKKIDTMAEHGIGVDFEG